jgi:hypothetical protein
MISCVVTAQQWLSVTCETPTASYFALKNSDSSESADLV